jgi:hypothetical protein
MNYALGLLGVFIVSGLILLRVVNRVWAENKAYLEHSGQVK